MTTKFVIYRRISGGTNQIKSGLGLEAQMTEINCYLQGIDDHVIVDQFTEIASGKDHQNRPILQSAIEKSIQTNSIVLVSRICRLSRDLEFTASLMKSNKVKFRIATMPTADNFIIAIYAAMVQKDREMISIRTKNALREAKKKGKKLGIMGKENIKQANLKKIQQADEFADKVKKVVIPMREEGKTYLQIANILSDVNFLTPRGCKFTPSSVQRYCVR